MKRWLSEAWYNDSSLVKALLPLSWLFGVLAARQQRRLLPTAQTLAVPLIIVGNITAGGTGKTPVCLALAKHFVTQGKRVVFVSRGYGGEASAYPLVVTPQTNTAQAGDEAVLLARHSGCPVVVDPERVRAARLAVTELKADLIISDDGLQHYALGRTVEIAVIDGARGVGNNLLLPAGPLREPATRLQTVNYVVINGPLQKVLPVAINNPINLSLQATALVNLLTGERLDPQQWLLRHGATNSVHAVAGIGNTARFFSSLQQLGFVIMPHAFADHHAYHAGDLAFTGDATVVMTTKDAVKCERFARPHWWALEVDAVLPDEFLRDLDNKIRQQNQSVHATSV